MRVLITVASLDRSFGGPAVKSDRLAHELRSLGHDVILVGGASAVVGRDASADQTVGLPIVARFHGTPITSRLADLARLAAAAEVVHAMGMRDPVGTVACLAASRARVPYLLEPSGMHRRRLRSVRLKAAYDRILGDRLLAGAAAVVATSALEARELMEDGVNSSVVTTRPNGIDVGSILPLPERGSFRRQHGVPAGAPLVLSLGRIAKKKGLVMFAEALAQVEGAWGAVVGPDDGDGALQELDRARDRLSLERMVVVPHGLWGPEKAQVLADADAFCLPSATENFGIAPAEAAGVGLPVVVSAECGVVEFLDEASTEVVDEADASTVAEGIERALKQEARVAARSSSKDIRERLDWGRMAQLQFAIYERARRGLGQGASS